MEYERDIGMEEYMKKYEEWINSPDFDEETKEELKKIKENKQPIKMNNAGELYDYLNSLKNNQ